jgi:uncharacterized protein (DUF305 family)
MKASLRTQSILLVVVASVGVALALAGCSTPKTGTTNAEFNDADVAFASGMIPHHQQAVVMSDWAVTRASDPKVKALAKRITAAQGPEITTMTSWLTAWDQPVPEPYDASADHGDHSMQGGDMGMDMGGGGMMSAEDMTKLEDARGAAFDREFLIQMIAHHEGAIAMAKDEVKSGSNPSALELAGQIEKAQSAEIAEMKGLLAD